MGILDIIGPTMIGPSSSHTAGAARLGRYTSLILGGEPEKITITLKGSFAHTGQGHGTDLAILAGLMGAKPDDLLIPRAKEVATERGLVYQFKKEEEYDYHPNEAELIAEREGKILRIVGTSVGGGRIRVRELNRYKIDLGGEYSTLLASYQDQPGMVAKITAILAAEKINIAQMNVARERRGGGALLLAEMDSTISERALAKLAQEVKWVRIIGALED